MLPPLGDLIQATVLGDHGEFLLELCVSIVLPLEGVAQSICIAMLVGGGGYGGSLNACKRFLILGFGNFSG
ncbi:hypothetical protein F2P79_012749 [Pimephales promelas]|nr:hypothetical protein F2P79_012749 [Pimephales promelas]